MKDILTILKERREKLEKLTMSNRNYNSSNSRIQKAHEERISSAAEYIKEIDSLIPILEMMDNKTIHLVPANIFDKKIETADYATIEDEGFYFKLAHVSNFPSEEFTLLCLLPLSYI